MLDSTSFMGFSNLIALRLSVIHDKNTYDKKTKMGNQVKTYEHAAYHLYMCTYLQIITIYIYTWCMHLH